MERQAACGAGEKLFGLLRSNPASLPLRTGEIHAFDAQASLRPDTEAPVSCRIALPVII
ncbi:hypothetical protein CE91St46_23600 [Eubacteriales bacterium]|nr:hypothetical protein CE91St46_23600 [Eubacteriales bacterium]GKH63967.1 hypothetical protein CE91St47_24360 [Eubacteriales bacterium]